MVIELLGEIAHYRGIAQRCAADCANYIHPRLANMQHGGDPDNPLKLEGGVVTDIERLQASAAWLAENPKLLDQLFVAAIPSNARARSLLALAAAKRWRYSSSRYSMS
jgi:hypothetical protein